MDTLSHGLWATAVGKGVNLRFTKKIKVGLMALWGIIPDLFAFWSKPHQNLSTVGLIPITHNHSILYEVVYHHGHVGQFYPDIMGKLFHRKTTLILEGSYGLDLG